MNTSHIIPAIALVAFSMLSGCTNAKVGPVSLFEEMDGPRSTILFDNDWKFFQGEAEGAEAMNFIDDSWRILDLPHDWSIEDIPGTESPINPSAVGGISSGYYVGGTGWYRKAFEVPDPLEGKRFFLQFDGIYMDADIWINGLHLGNHPYGYTSFWYDISDKLSFDEKNIIAVRVRNEGKNSRWYSGSGIYRHVWLTTTEPVHVVPWGTFVTTPKVEQAQATIVVSNEIANLAGAPGSLIIHTEILDGSGEVVASNDAEIEVGKGATVQFTSELAVSAPDLWSIESPTLYTAVTEILDGTSEQLDRVENSFGIRSISFTTEGFYLNGENILLKGGCVHHDNGPLGAAAYDRAEERKVEILKASGFNSIRCAHNPPSPAFLDACDNLGILVIDESFDMWSRQKNPKDYHRFFDKWWKEDVKSMVQRDRNHPSIIMWSTGNEIPERGEPKGVEESQMLAEYIHELDPSRPVTSAVNGLGPDKDPYFATLDISGYNYSFGGDHEMESIFKSDHKRKAERIMYCSESYPLTAFGSWMDVVDNPYVIGDYVWTGFDYLGEASIGWLGYPHEGSFYPWNHAYCGDIDICGIKRPQSYYRDVLWKSGQLLSLFVKPPEPSFEENPDRKDWSKWHWQDVSDRWNWPGHEGKPLEVEVYCAHEEVELFLNGNSLGRKETKRATEWIARWSVPYEPGSLKAVAYQGNEKADAWELVTASVPERISLSADRSVISADGRDLSYIVVEIQDMEGNRNTMADNLVHFEIEGPGSILAVASSNPMSNESFQQARRKAYKGRCMVIVKSTDVPGKLTLNAISEGLQSALVSIETN